MAVTRRMAGFFAVAAAMRVCAAEAPPAPEREVRRLDTGSFQAFVVNWAPADQPLCAVMQTAAQWERVFHPAPVMFGGNVFGPPADFWSDHAVLLVARVVPGGTASAFASWHVQPAGPDLAFDYALAPTAPSSFRIKASLAVSVRKPVRGHVRFVEDGRDVCELDADAGPWVRPDLDRP